MENLSLDRATTALVPATIVLTVVVNAYRVSKDTIYKLTTRNLKQELVFLKQPLLQTWYYTLHLFLRAAKKMDHLNNHSQI